MKSSFLSRLCVLVGVIGCDKEGLRDSLLNILNSQSINSFGILTVIVSRC